MRRKNFEMLVLVSEYRYSSATDPLQDLLMVCKMRIQIRYINLFLTVHNYGSRSAVSCFIDIDIDIDIDSLFPKHTNNALL